MIFFIICILVVALILYFVFPVVAIIIKLIFSIATILIFLGFLYVFYKYWKPMTIKNRLKDLFSLIIVVLFFLASIYLIIVCGRACL